PHAQALGRCLTMTNAAYSPHLMGWSRNLKAHGLRIVVAFLLLALSAGVVRADVALLRNGRSLSVTDYRKDGDRILLVIEGGGEITLPNGQVVAIRRDPPPVPAPPAPSGPAGPAGAPAIGVPPGPSMLVAPEPRADD